MAGLEQAWQEFFQSGFYADRFWSFGIKPEQTFKEVEGVIKMLSIPAGAKVLDWCGGWGRHSLELARRGFRVTLLDFAQNHLARAQQDAEAVNLPLETVLADFRQTPSWIQADFAINLFTAGIGYLTEEDDIKALMSLRLALKPGALFLLDTINLFWLAKNYRASDWRQNDTGTQRLLEEREFDFLTNRIRARLVYWEQGKEERRAVTDHRAYSPAELANILRIAGFQPLQLYGGFDGQPFSFDSRRLVMISRR